jgi:hypothetical protein
MRDLLARRFDDLLARTRQPHLPSDPRVPGSRVQVVAAAEEIHHVADVLRARRPVSAHGVAAVSTLLTRPDSPVYRRGRRAGELARALDAAIGRM